MPIRRSQKPLGRVFMDIAGPVSVTALGGFKYFMVLVDDCTRRIFVYLRGSGAWPQNMLRSFAMRLLMPPIQTDFPPIVSGGSLLPPLRCFYHSVVGQ
mmetsp:Transcript_9932/g.19883  ORF Transcript_9932/g.19883 Transcript_9932/m.19883 type:complete len:98 (-) Transcript_9932:58-351(-)